MKELSKDEMKKVMGGAEIICGYWPAPGYTMVLTTCEGDIDGCTHACNAWCNIDPACVNNSCTCM